MDDLGAPISYLVLEKGADVYTSEGEKIGKVAEVQADTGEDIFEGIVVNRTPLLPGGEELITADRIEEIYERGVVLAPGA
ncbi:MAG: PRC-barrel domain-containing protein [Vicinamibacteria bacterium]|jgi:sporulation protein YlmC with PRC-barrel domain